MDLLESHRHYLDQKLAQHDRDFLLTRSFVASGDRLYLSALHALRAELRGIIDTVRDPTVALNKIDWWRGEWQRLAEQRARHPVTLVLQQLLVEPPPPLSDVILLLAQACSTDSSWQSVADRIEYSRRFAAPFAALEAARVGAAPGTGLQRCWQDIELLALASDLGRWARSGRRALPSDLLAPQSMERRAEGQSVKSLEMAIRDLVAQTLEQVGLDYQGCGLRHAHIYRQVQLARLNWWHKNPETSAELSNLRRLWAAWRGARFARRNEL